MQRKITAGQQRALDVIENLLKLKGYSPTQREVAVALGINQSAARKHILALEKAEYLYIHQNQSRSIELIKPVQEGIPVLGRIAAGVPIAAIEHVDHYLDLPESFFRIQPDYLLRVVGDSMELAGILDGDLAAIKQQATANNGDIVAARIDEEVTLKTLKVSAGQIALMPHNDHYSPIILNAEQLIIEGICVGIVRSY